jgi:hypothetical protein
MWRRGGGGQNIWQRGRGKVWMNKRRNLNEWEQKIERGRENDVGKWVALKLPVIQWMGSMGERKTFLNLKGKKKCIHM